MCGQALDEKEDQHVANGGRHETLLDGVLIGTDADRSEHSARGFTVQRFKL